MKLLNDFVLQVHITNRCNFDCPHCYIEKHSGDMSLEMYVELMDNYTALMYKLNKISNNNITPVIHITGGDPILHSNLGDMIDISLNHRMKVGILGNPFLKEDNDNAEYMLYYFRNTIESYQVSIDGNRSMHDSRRGKGSYDKAIQFLKNLKSFDIKGYVAFNIDKTNFTDVEQVYQDVKDIAYSFSYSRVVNIGNGKTLDTSITPKEYKTLIKTMNETPIGKCFIANKDPLVSLYNYECGSLLPTEKIVGGCGIGTSLLSVDVDGSIYPCRRLPIKIGNLDLTTAFFESSVLNELRDYSAYKKCSSCELINNCRGCPAIAYANTGNFYEADKQCWKNKGVIKWQKE